MVGRLTKNVAAHDKGSRPEVAGEKGNNMNTRIEGGSSRERKRRGKPLKWKVVSLALRTIGRTSDGIALGFRRGFDSGPMLDYVYENRARGRMLVGRLVDRVYLDAIGWRAIRARKEALKNLLSELIVERSRKGLKTAILDVASGPGRYLQETWAELRDGGNPEDVAVICRDLDPSGLEQGRRRATAQGLDNFRYEVGDACDPGSLGSVTPRPDIVVASGLYELLDPALIQRSMAGIREALAPGGHFVFTTQSNHPQLELIANTLTNRHGEPWVMVCRSLEETEGWARGAGFEVLGSKTERVGLFGITTCRKRE